MAKSDQESMIHEGGAATAGVEELQMYLGQKCRLSGVLKVQGMARIDGCVEGEIYGSDLIQVGKEGKIEATVRAKDIIAQGPLRGDFVAQHKLQLLAPATLVGQIDTPVFLLEEGVFVNGTLKMGMGSTCKTSLSSEDLLN